MQSPYLISQRETARMTVTETQKANLIPFTKGDKRINRRGRITNFTKLRKLALEVGNETIDESEAITRFTALLRVMSSSRNPADRMGFLAYAVGKPKDEVELTGKDGAALIPPQIIEVIKTYVKDE